MPTGSTRSSSTLERVRRRTYEIVEVAGEGDRASRVFDVTIAALIVANIVALVLDTVQSIHVRVGAAFEIFELVSVVAFSVEYVLRLWSCTVDERYREPLAGRLRFALTFMALIDLFAVLPFYLPFFGFDLRVVWVMRLFRLLRFAKLHRYSKALQTFARVLRSRAEALLISLALVLALLLIASCVMYFAEHDAQPERFSSIPAAMWWAWRRSPPWATATARR